MDSIQDQREAPELAAMERVERGLGLALSQSDREWIQIKIVNNKPERRDTCSNNAERGGKSSSGKVSGSGGLYAEVVAKREQ